MSRGMITDTGAVPPVAPGLLPSSYPKQRSCFVNAEMQCRTLIWALRGLAHGCGDVLGPVSDPSRVASFDHDADHRLGAGWAQQYAAASVEIRFGFRHGALHFRAPHDVCLVSDSHVEQHLREQRERARRLCKGGPVFYQSAEHLQRGDDAVSRAVLVEAHDVARILSTELPAALRHHLQHVAVAHARTRERDLEPGKRLLQGEIGHQGPDY